jgi:predicted SnoaL-like aldol condensation-catalyzing enzyme
MLITGYSQIQGASMDVEANKQIVRRYVELWNTGNTALADDILAPTYVDHAHPEVSGSESVKQALQQTRAAFPDFAISIDSLIGERDMVALRVTIRRTRQGQEIVSQIIWFVRIENGKMAELWTGAEASR